MIKKFRKEQEEIIVTMPIDKESEQFKKLEKKYLERKEKLEKFFSIKKVKGVVW